MLNIIQIFDISPFCMITASHRYIFFSRGTFDEYNSHVYFFFSVYTSTYIYIHRLESIWIVIRIVRQNTLNMSNWVLVKDVCSSLRKTKFFWSVPLELIPRRETFGDSECHRVPGWCGWHPQRCISAMPWATLSSVFEPPVYLNHLLCACMHSFRLISSASFSTVNRVANKTTINHFNHYISFLEWRTHFGNERERGGPEATRPGRRLRNRFSRNMQIFVDFPGNLDYQDAIRMCGRFNRWMSKSYSISPIFPHPGVYLRYTRNNIHLP